MATGYADLPECYIIRIHCLCYQESVSVRGSGRDELDWAKSGICLFVGSECKDIEE